MNTVERRLRKLELIHGGKEARLIVVSVPAGWDDDGPGEGTVSAFLARMGIQTTERDLVVTVLSRCDRGELKSMTPSLLMLKDR